MSHKIIALWSHPRSMSTAFERIMRERGDLECLHEPFMYDYYINRSKRPMPHFDAIDGHPRSYPEIRDMILAKAERGPVFFKDMSYYVMPRIMADTAFLNRVTHSFLVRDPKAAIVSYAKLDPDFTREELGIEAQWRQVEGLMARGQSPVVMQSERVQADPAGEMQRYWSAVDLSDEPKALEWGEETPPDWHQVAAWHQDVLSSKSIRPPDAASVQKAANDFARLLAHQPRFEAILAHHYPHYERLLALGRS